jgi:predicted GNAT family N-acyltransferase
LFGVDDEARMREAASVRLAVFIEEQCTLREARSRGAGRIVLDALLTDARRRGYLRAVLNAQDHVIGFYAKAGFVASGETMVECAIVHQPMVRELA